MLIEENIIYSIKIQKTNAPGVTFFFYVMLFGMSKMC